MATQAAPAALARASTSLERGRDHFTKLFDQYSAASGHPPGYPPLTAEDLANAVALQDKSMVARAPGVGPKVAARIVVELRDKMPALAPAIRAGGGVAPVAMLPEGTSARDAVSALTNLGYGHAQAAAAVSLAVGKAGREARTEELIRLGLRELAQ